MNILQNMDTRIPGARKAIKPIHVSTFDHCVASSCPQQSVQDFVAHTADSDVSVMSTVLVMPAPSV